MGLLNDAAVRTLARQVMHAEPGLPVTNALRYIPPNLHEEITLGTATTDVQPYIQAAVDDLETQGHTGIKGGVLFFPPGQYLIQNPIILPRTGSSPTGVVHLVGANVRAVRLRGGSSFPTNRALVEWEAVDAQTWHQRLARLTLWLPSVAGTMAIHYAPTDQSTQAAMLSETLQVDLDDILIEGDNTYHAHLIYLQGNIKNSRLRRVVGDAIRGSETFDTIVLETETTYPNDDGSGLVYSQIHGLYAGQRLGGWLQAFKGRMHSATWDTCFANGTRAAPTYEFINSSVVRLRNLIQEGKGPQPQWKLDTCKLMTLEHCGTGSPTDQGLGVGNGIEMVACEDITWNGHFKRSGNPAFSASSVKQLTLDANTTRCRFSNFLLAGSLANEVTDSGTDNYGEFYDVNGGAWYFLGAERIGVTAQTVRTFTSTDTTPSVAGGTLFKTNNGSATTITTFDDGVSGQDITVIFTDANTTIAETGNIKLSAAFTSSADDTMRLVYDGTSWFELSRSVN